MKQHTVYVLAPPERNRPVRSWVRFHQDPLTPEETAQLRDALATLPDLPKIRCIVSSNEVMPLAAGQALSTLCCQRWRELPEYLRTFELRAPRGSSDPEIQDGAFGLPFYQAYLEGSARFPNGESAQDVNRRIDAAVYALFHRFAAIGKSADSAAALLVAEPILIRRMFGKMCGWSAEEEYQASFPPLSLHAITIKGRRNGHRFTAVQPALVVRSA